ncbi:ABC transporter substrate-binding protein [Ruania alba]|uniref:Peptide/nickel transport system substrate-binding protein n=1 Tax=Ruania alba TaxID=648782 RepID=A0A1H5M8Z4_9MICO|nr:ABC transporter substrate-binding protein [Ruania alba]SEE85603.1 peptide/nickel transport system substrate-binding protein [Ruania alba]
MRDSTLQNMPRRNFLVLGGGALATSFLVSGCDLLDEGGDGGNGTSAEKGAEAPDLAARVEAGDLPPVEERLPSAPSVVEPVDRVGIYGGSWRTAMLGAANSGAWVDFTIGGEYLVTFQPNTTDMTAQGVVANVAESFEYSDDSTQYTFTLREGMRWSDGEPLTADDIMFWYEAVFLNDDLYPAKTSWLTSAGEPVVVEKLDDYTVTFTFAQPNGLFLSKMAQEGDQITRSPKHYLSQFHPDYADDIDALIAEEGASSWVELFAAKGGTFDTRYNNPELPTLSAWVLDHGLNEDVQEFVATRNPYYWKVDPEGSQLPYIDTVNFPVYSDVEALTLNAINGELDFHFPNIGQSTNKPLFAENREDGNYDFISIERSHSVAPVIQLNLAHQDAVKREIFQNKDFRIGLSHAINRQAIIDAVYARQGEPYQASPRPSSEFYDEEMAHQYTEYDVDLANEFLDRAGYTETNGNGIRLGPDGNPISFEVEAMVQRTPDVDSMQFVKDDWQAVGIEITIKSEDPSLYTERLNGNQHDAAVHFATGGLNALVEPSMYFPFGPFSRYALPWMQWYTSRGEAGEEPIEPVKRQMELYDELTTVADADRQKEILTEILQIAKEEFYTIGISLWADAFGIVKNDFHNVPENLVTGAYPNPASTNPCQYFRE